MRQIAILALAALAACNPLPSDRVAMDGATGAVMAVVPVTERAAQGATRSNDEIAADFLDLEFQLESGLTLPHLSRFDGPITVRMTGQVPLGAAGEMARLVARLRSEAGIELGLVGGDSPASITVEFAAKSTLQRFEPGAACFVAPNVSSLRELRVRRGSEALAWQGLVRRERVAIFVPSDTSPQELRDCLHEEVAQALGPLNDLYRLPDSVFNDDNFQSVLTGFDMLILRLHYAPELSGGMARGTVAARLPGLLARLNPAGAYPGFWAAPDTPREWLRAADVALGAQSLRAKGRLAAERMLAIAEAEGWNDARLGLSWFALGRLQAPVDPGAAEASFRQAALVYASLPDEGVHLSHALMQLAAIALASGRPLEAITISDQALPLARRGQNAALTASLSWIKAEALGALGRISEAEALRLDLLPAARYGFGTAGAARARAAEIAALVGGTPGG